MIEPHEIHQLSQAKKKTEALQMLNKEKDEKKLYEICLKIISILKK